MTHLQLDSLKSRLQSSRDNPSISRLAAEVVREEGIGGSVLLEQAEGGADKQLMEGVAVSLTLL